MASESTPIIVDTSVMFSALVSGPMGLANVLLNADHEFFVCEFLIVELFKHRYKLVKVSHLSEDEILRLLYLLLKRINIFKEDLIATENRVTAYTLCVDIDEKDTPHVALTLELKGLLWTVDKKLRSGLQGKSFDQFFDPSRS